VLYLHEVKQTNGNSFMNANIMTALKAAGAVTGVAVAGFGAYKAVEHFKAKPSTDSQIDQADTIAPSIVENTNGSEASNYQKINATALSQYPGFLASTFPNLQIREGCVFELGNKDYLLIEGTDVKFDDNHRPQAILFILDEEVGNFKMISSVTVSGDTVSYNHNDPGSKVYIGYLNAGNVKSFSGSGKDEPIPNFKNDFVVAQ
jgi:hypothetical protein